MVYLRILKVTGLGKICGQSYGLITVLEKNENLKNLKKIHRIIIRHNAFVVWALLPGA